MLRFGRLQLNPARLIYGTIVLVALLGILAESETIAAPRAIGVILGASFALWLAHSFSEGVAAQLRLGRHLHLSEMKEIAIGEYSVVAVVAIPVGLLVCAGLGWLETETALSLSVWIGIGILAAAGWALGEGGRLSPAGRLLSAVISAGLGTIIVLIEIAFSH